MELNLKPKRKTEIWGINKKGEKWEGWILCERSFFKLNHVASLIWENLNGKSSIQKIIEIVSNSYPNIEIKIIKNDVLKLLRKWEKDGLIFLDYQDLEYLIESVEYPLKESTLPYDEIDILLCSVPSSYPRETIIRKLELFPPLGIGYIASFLRNHGYKVECANLSALENESIVKVLEKIILEREPKLIGFSVNTEQINSALLLCKLCKKVNPDAITILGGPHPTFMDIKILHDQNVDLIVRNEGEITMLEVARYFLEGFGALENIEGISFKSDDGTIHRNKPRPLIDNLDSLPFPEREFLVPSRKITSKSVPISTSRGCPFKCRFCSAGAMSGGKYRMKSPENVVEEIKFLKRMGIKTVHFVDDTVTGIPQRLIKICELVEPLSIEWTAESRVDIFSKNEKLAKILKKSGCVALQFGVESSSQLILDRSNKKIKIEQILNAVETALEEGINVACSMIIGHPEDTFQSVLDSINFAIQLEKMGAAVFWGILTPYPGTYIFEHAESLGIQIISFNYEDYILSNPVISTKYLSADELRWLYIYALQKSIEYLPEKWVNFMQQRISQDILNE